MEIKVDQIQKYFVVVLHDEIECVVVKCNSFLHVIALVLFCISNGVRVTSQLIIIVTSAECSKMSSFEEDSTLKQLLFDN